MPGMYADGDYDLAGFAVGAVERDAAAAAHRHRARATCVLGLASSGLHSNGYSLVRKIVEPRLGRAAPFARQLGEALLDADPHLREAAAGGDPRPEALKGLAHITGGGLPGNVPRVPAGRAARRGSMRGAWPPPPVFGWLRAEGGVPTDEMLRTFNCGIGMVVVVAPEPTPDAVTRRPDRRRRDRARGRRHRAAPTAEADCIVEHADSLWRS